VKFDIEKCVKKYRAVVFYIEKRKLVGSLQVELITFVFYIEKRKLIGILQVELITFVFTS